MNGMRAINPGEILREDFLPEYGLSVTALAEAAGDGRIKQGQLVLLEAIGGGLTWGASVIRW